jgi:hypothetical protein
VNDWTLRQWWHYADANLTCPDCAWLLLWLVRDHDAGKGIAHPGVTRLTDTCHRNRRWVLRHLRELNEGGHILLVQRYPWATHKADEYALPWLANGITALVQKRTGRPDKRRRSPVRQRTGEPVPEHTGERTGERTASLSPYGEKVPTVAVVGASNDAAAADGGVPLVRPPTTTSGEQSAPPPIPADARAAIDAIKSRRWSGGGP